MIILLITGFPQVVPVHSQPTPQTIKSGEQVASIRQNIKGIEIFKILKLFVIFERLNPKSQKRLQESVWFEDSPSRPRVDLFPKSTSKWCPPGCWPILRQELALRSLRPESGRLLAASNPISPPPWSIVPYKAGIQGVKLANYKQFFQTENMLTFFIKWCFCNHK